LRETRQYQIGAIGTVAKKKHTKILEELKKHLASGELEVRITAAEEIGKYKKEVKAADILLATSKANLGREETIVLAVKCMRYLGCTGVRSKGKEIPSLFGERDTDYVMEVLDTCAKLKSRRPWRRRGPVRSSGRMLAQRRKRPRVREAGYPWWWGLSDGRAL